MDKSLRYAAVAGIISLLSLVPVIIFDILKEFGRANQKFLFIYIALSFISIAAYLIFMWAFKIIGEKTKNTLLVAMAYLTIILSVLFYLYDMLGLLYPSLDNVFMGVAILILSGIVGIPYGIAQLRLKKKLGGVATAAGVLNIITAACFITVLLAVVGLLLLIPTAIVEIVLVFRASKKL
ncbi:hypothetical protein HYV81_01815 [Candidatus Woesearchaeota archaeon]|nr:hypothetical protein [Candidatus Woesearchaeota archaeon]